LGGFEGLPERLPLVDGWNVLHGQLAWTRYQV